MCALNNSFKTKVYEPSKDGVAMLIGFSTSGYLDKWILSEPEMSMGRFGSGEDLAISIPSSVVSKKHGLFSRIDNQVYYTDLNSTNGTLINGVPVTTKTPLSNGDIISISLQNSTLPMIIFIFQYYPTPDLSVQELVITDDIEEITIGHNSEISNSKSALFLNDDYISRRHAALIPRGDIVHVFDFKSTNGIFINNERINDSAYLNNMDVLQIGSTYGCFSNNKITFVTPISIKTYNVKDFKQEPIIEQQEEDDGSSKNSLQINIVRKVVGSGSKKKVLLKDINTKIDDGDFVLVLGGSGAGKSTFFKAVMGYSQAEGDIFYGDIDVYNDYDRIKYEIGYVPQENLVRFDNSVYNTLVNAASMKMPAGCSKQVYEERASEVIQSLGLEQVQNNLVGRVSGGQLRRVCIGIELTGDPNIFFLDEPDSGLDEPVAASIREDLRKIADNGKIVLAITHSPDIKSELFTRVIVIAKCSDDSGHLLFSGSPKEALQFFEVTLLSEIMAKINTVEENGEGLADYFLDKWNARSAN